MWNLKCKGAVFGTALLLITGCVTTKAPVEPTPPPPDEPAAMESVTKGRVALARENYAEASARFQEALRYDPGNDQAELGMAEVYLGFGAYDDAFPAFDDLIESPEVGVEAIQGLGITLLFMGSRDEAYEALNEAVSQAPDLWRAWNGLGWYYALEQEWSKSEAAFRKAVDVAPEPHAAAVWNNLGMAFMAQNRYEDAVSHFTMAIEHDAGLEIARTNLRFALAFQGKYAQALAGTDRKELPNSLNNIGYIALLRGDYARAEAYFLRAMESSPAFHDVASKNLELLASMKKINTAEASARTSEGSTQ